jgi:hypothetical protein
VHLLERGFRVRCTQVADPERGVIPGGAYGGGYRMPGGDRMFLEELARLDGPGASTAQPRDAAPTEGRPRAREARAPGFAVLVDPDEQDAGNLVALRSTFEPAVAFVTDGASRRVLSLLEEADWRIVRVRRPAEIGQAWSGIALSARADLAARSTAVGAARATRGDGEEPTDAP